MTLMVWLWVWVWLGLPTKTPPERAFWSSREVCEFLGIPLSTLRYWSWQGSPCSYRIGRERKYRPADVMAWTERQAAEPAADLPPEPPPKPPRRSSAA